MAAVTKDCADVLAGPADLLFADESRGHTQGGVTVVVSPQSRPVNVDEHGQSDCRMIHIGDQARVNTSLAQWVAEVLQDVYPQGNDQTAAADPKFMGIGRSAGFDLIGKDLKVKPIATADVNKAFQLWLAVPAGEITLNFNHDDDRTFSQSWAGLIDDAKPAGEKLGRIYLTGPVT